MKRRHFIRTAGTTAMIVTGLPAISHAASTALKSGEILHTVLFDLKHAPDSDGASRFLADARRILTGVPGVRDFQACRQCSPKNEFQYGFLMTFDCREAFDAYTAHPEHAKFVKERWETEVTRFQESDFVKL
jgi:heme-degrading monooxygenase HmoA